MFATIRWAVAAARVAAAGGLPHVGVLMMLIRTGKPCTVGWFSTAICTASVMLPADGSPGSFASAIWTGWPRGTTTLSLVLTSGAPPALRS